MGWAWIVAEDDTEKKAFGRTHKITGASSTMAELIAIANALVSIAMNANVVIH
jgi:ribonuclease HI